MTPVLTGRLQTRLYLTGSVGVVVTAVITPLLPTPSGMDIGAAYRMTFESLGLMAFLGLLWELVYHLVQQTRWDKDWPSLLGLLTVLNEAIVLWFVDHALGVVPGTTGTSSPFLVLFTIHVGVTWLAMWLFLQGPVRVLLVRWRFEGSRVLVPAPGRWRRDDDWLDTRWLESLRSPRIAAEPTTIEADTADVVGIGRPTATLVEGVRCPNGHFGNADVRYCVVCGTATVPSAPTLGPRPPLGMLILADGSTRVLDEDLVVTEEDGILTFRSLDEQPTEPSIAEIRLVGWQPVVSGVDRPVSVVLPGGERLPAAPNVPVPLVPGASVVLGDHTIRYDSPYAADPKGVPMMASRANRLTPQTRRSAAIAAAVVTIVGAIVFGLLSGSAGQTDRRAVAQPGPTTPLLPPFSVPSWTLPTQATTTKNGLLPIVLPGPPTGPVLHLPPPVPVLPPPPGSTTTPPPPTTGTPTPSPTDTTPITPLPPAAVCDANLMGMLQCTLGGLLGH